MYIFHFPFSDRQPFHITCASALFADHTFDVLYCWIPLRYILCNSLNGLPSSNPCIPAVTLQKDMDLSYNIKYGKGAMLYLQCIK